MGSAGPTPDSREGSLVAVDGFPSLAGGFGEGFLIGAVGFSAGLGATKGFAVAVGTGAGLGVAVALGSLAAADPTKRVAHATQATPWARPDLRDILSDIALCEGRVKFAYYGFFDAFCAGGPVSALTSALYSTSRRCTTTDETWCSRVSFTS